MLPLPRIIFSAFPRESQTRPSQTRVVWLAAPMPLTGTQTLVDFTRMVREEYAFGSCLFSFAFAGHFIFLGDFVFFSKKEKKKKRERSKPPRTAPIPYPRDHLTWIGFPLRCFATTATCGYGSKFAACCAQGTTCSTFFTGCYGFTDALNGSCSSAKLKTEPQMACW